MLEELLFPEIKETPENIIAKYPKRPVWQVVTRIAPSPTWFFHIWTLYTTIVDKIFAYKNNWILYLRAEDTDQKREIEWAMQKYIDILKKFWIEFDEWPVWDNYEDIWNYWPYTQSQREYIYKVFLKSLVAKWLAYPCFLTEEEINNIRTTQEQLKAPIWIYWEYSVWRNASFSDIKKALEEKKEFVIRYKSSGNMFKKIEVFDEIKWKVNIWENFLDVVIMKVSWLPTYHFAHVIDDFLMQTSLVIRWDEWFASLPLHLQMFQTFWFNPPKYAHISPLVKIDWDSRRKLSKRKDTEANVEYYFQSWYLTEAIIDYICNLINSWFEEWRKQNIDKKYLDFDFKLEKMSSSWALIDTNKLNWINSNFIKNMDIETLYNKLQNYLIEFEKDFFDNIFSKFNEKYNKKIIQELQTRIIKFDEFIWLTTFFYNDFEINDKIKNLLLNPKMKIENIDIIKKWLYLALEILSAKKNEFWNIQEIKDIFVEKISQAQMKNWQVLWPVRVALSWKEFSPWALELISILWKKKSIEKIKKILDLI